MPTDPIVERLNLVEEENYTVFEYDQEAIDLGIEDFPDADFRKWNIHNQMNNPGGDIDAPLPFVDSDKFDLIFTYMKTLKNFTTTQM